VRTAVLPVLSPEDSEKNRPLPSRFRRKRVVEGWEINRLRDQTLREGEGTGRARGGWKQEEEGKKRWRKLANRVSHYRGLSRSHLTVFQNQGCGRERVSMSDTSDMYTHAKEKRREGEERCFIRSGDDLAGKANILPSDFSEDFRFALIHARTHMPRIIVRAIVSSRKTNLFSLVSRFHPKRFSATRTGIGRENRDDSQDIARLRSRLLTNSFTLNASIVITRL